MSAEPKPEGSNSQILEIHTHILTIQRAYRDRIIQELPAPVCPPPTESYVLENQKLPFLPSIFRELCLRLAPLLKEQAPQADFVPLLCKLDDPILEKLAAELQQVPEQDLPQALELAAQEARLQRLSPIDEEALLALLLAAFVPFFSAFARQQLNLNSDKWQKGWCPVCGQYPINGYNRSGDGRRIFGCWMCETEWSFARLSCPVCNSQNQDRQVILTPLGEKARRIHACEECGHYFKITDCTQAATNCDLSLENAATVYLDVLAQRKGYRPASRPQSLKQ